MLSVWIQPSNLSVPGEFTTLHFPYLLSDKNQQSGELVLRLQPWLFEMQIIGPKSGLSFTKTILIRFTHLKLTHRASSWCYVCGLTLEYVNDHRFSSDNLLLPDWPRTTFCSTSSFGWSSKVLMAGLPFYPNPTSLICITHRGPEGPVSGKICLFNYNSPTEGILGVMGGRWV